MSRRQIVIWMRHFHPEVQAPAHTHLGKEDYVGEDEVGNDTCTDDHCTLPNRSVLEQVRVIRGIGGAGIIIGEGYVAPEWERSEGVFYNLALRFETRQAIASGEV